MKYLVTGGAGFIGSHLADALLADGHRVCVLDDLSTGSLENVAHLCSRAGFTCVEGSATDASLVAELMEDVDAVFHLAAAVGVRLVVEHPVHTMDTNVRATETVLRLARPRRTRVILTSTSEVYGKSTAVPFAEDGDIVLGPTTHSRWSYACSKALDEFMALAYWREHHVPTTIARLFNTVGPRQTAHYGMVIPRLVAQALAGEPLTVYGDGMQSRCFMHVGDAVRALVLLAASDGTAGEVFNVGSTEEIGIRALAERVRDAAGTSSPIVHVPYEVAYEEGFEDMRRRVPVIDKIRARLGWRPTTSLDGILESVIRHHRAMHGRPRAAAAAAP
jgi:UDP-glucose 4-epimerase